MSPATVAALNAAHLEMEIVELKLARAAFQIEQANVHQRLPEGTLDVADDIKQMQISAARLRSNLDALAQGKPIPA
jgi:hypothetical protein